MNQELIAFLQKAVQTRSYSDEEGPMAQLVLAEMQKLGYDEAYIDKTGNVVGRIGNGPKVIHFDSHMDTVQVNDPEDWEHDPFGGEIVDGELWGRGSVDMKGGLCASVYAAAAARDAGLLDGKTVYVTGTVCEEYCDGVNLQLFYGDTGLKPDFCVICEPSGNLITLGHKGKAQVRITTHGVSAHGSAPEKGKNAVYEMAEIIQRVEALNNRLFKADAPHGTVVLSDISCVSASLNAVPSECQIYLDRRLCLGETLEQVRAEMDELVAGKDATWEVGCLDHTSWNGRALHYEPMHDPWKTPEDAPISQALIAAYATVCGAKPTEFDFWDFGTNAITPIAMGVPTIGFGPGPYKLAHMTNEHTPVDQVEKAFQIYKQLIGNL